MNALEKRLLNEFQRDFPLSSTPYADIAKRVGASETEVLEALARLTASGAVSRVGPVIRPHSIGVSTLAAMRVPPERLPEIAALVSEYPEVNHNYEREHEVNLWFVLAAPTKQRLRQVLSDIERRARLAVLDLPLLADYHIDLGFEIKWS
ncbi:AsnC family transcriptional regulator [Sulfurifustis variabilis]|uniref:siroheme decarboxylase n=1 Tax=Sulfurifustis variabilis TaxID=1675686 RepID=A0A1B4V123_9GAMM|nr:AsnC family transcriptional regulator [Sulfurifustis variabilis]BAU46935.1 AsnC family transcriptional regulator [Sulfurifustis variabilis]